LSKIIQENDSQLPKVGSLSKFRNVGFNAKFTRHICLVAGAGYIINDYYDQEIDQINKPHKRLIGVRISEKNALLLYVILNFIALSISVFQPILGLINLFFGLILWVYARFLKKMLFIGNLIVALCVSSKDLEDELGDKTFACYTLPIALGHQRTKFVVFLFISLLGITLFLSSLLFSFENFLIYVSFAEIALCWSIYQLLSAKTNIDYRQLSRFYKLFMLSGVFSVVLF